MKHETAIHEGKTPVTIHQRHLSTSCAVIIDLTAEPEDVDVPSAINEAIVRNLAVVDFRQSQVLVKRGAHVYVADVRPNRPGQHAGVWAIDPENVELHQIT